MAHPDRERAARRAVPRGSALEDHAPLTPTEAQQWLKAGCAADLAGRLARAGATPEEYERSGAGRGYGFEIPTDGLPRQHRARFEVGTWPGLSCLDRLGPPQDEATLRFVEAMLQGSAQWTGTRGLLTEETARRRRAQRRLMHSWEREQDEREAMGLRVVGEEARRRQALLVAALTGGAAAPPEAQRMGYLPWEPSPCGLPPLPLALIVLLAEQAEDVLDLSGAGTDDMCRHATNALLAILHHHGHQPNEVSGTYLMPNGRMSARHAWAEIITSEGLAMVDVTRHQFYTRKVDLPPNVELAADAYGAGGKHLVRDRDTPFLADNPVRRALCSLEDPEKESSLALLSMRDWCRVLRITKPSGQRLAGSAIPRLREWLDEEIDLVAEARVERLLYGHPVRSEEDFLLLMRALWCLERWLCHHQRSPLWRGLREAGDDAEAVEGLVSQERERWRRRARPSMQTLLWRERTRIEERLRAARDLAPEMVAAFPPPVPRAVEPWMEEVLGQAARRRGRAQARRRRCAPRPGHMGRRKPGNASVSLRASARPSQGRDARARRSPRHR